ncbi:AMP-binding protein [Ornithinimicrobium faecis]|uniref:AMP-binding protein n=1 Tax=Ornithinimicrobium faecis TaxID=2934158 RepID=A0ABY4YSI3_9MICO|nr:AMP-binding protein [Ornithinimicrobium sp. HY1793]USQ79549.1 AMP-binding protein [Ornithinimicrobium sp. HY1793]
MTAPLPPEPPSPDSDVADLLRAAEHALAGTGVTLTTSGSTGQPKSVAISADALHASATATAERVGGHGHWLLTLPTDHVAGWQVVVRSALAGTVPAVLDGPFTVEAFVTAATTITAGPRLVSLVPTQLLRLLEHPSGRAAAADFDAVLVGGAALPATVLARAEAAGITVLRTYGMTETSGGCVYDATPLRGVQVALDEGRVLLGGPVLATEYLGDPALTAERFSTDSTGQRWFRTDDVGELDGDGRLRLLGRADDVINTGGFKVAPRPVEEALTQLPQVREALVLGVPDAEWGQRVTAVLVAHPDATTPNTSSSNTATPDTAAVRDLLRDQLPAHALPRQVVWLEALPLLPSGKPDRVALRTFCASEDGTMDSHPGSRA